MVDKPRTPTKAEHDAWVKAHGRPYTQRRPSIKQTQQPTKGTK